MTIDLLHYNFKLFANKVDSLADRDFLPAEIDEYLNKAIEYIVDTKFSVFEVTQKNIDSYGSILTRTTIVPTSVNNTTYYIDLPADYRYYARGEILGNACSTMKIKVVQLDDLGHYLSSNVIKPSFKWGRCIGAFEQNRLYLYTDGYTITNVTLTYIKNPTIVTIGGYNDITGSPKTTTQTDLPEHLHHDIVDIAVKLAQGVLENSFGFQVAATLSDFNNEKGTN